MPHQRAVTVRAPVAADHAGELVGLLSAAGRDGSGGGLLPFSRVPGLHFARLCVLEATTDLAGSPLPAALLYMADVDRPRIRHLRDLVHAAGPGLDRTFGHCADYPVERLTDRKRVAWMRAHLVRSDAAYVNTVGRGVRQIQQEAHLRASIEDMLDERVDGWGTLSALQVYRAVRDFVASRADLVWALRPPRPPSLLFRLREGLHKVLAPATVLLLSPLLLLVLPGWAVLLRLHERRDVPDAARPSLHHVRELADYEDHVTQNPFTAVGFVKPGPFRSLTLRAVLLAVNYGVRHLFAREDLAGVKTIHFARWVALDDRRRVAFVSSYDGSLESYMDDFIDKVAWGLNAVFSNGVGYPRSRWLVAGGARDELVFKNHLRCHQLPTQVWWSAYDTLSARNVAANAAVRRALSTEPTPEQAREWLALL